MRKFNFFIGAMGGALGGFILSNKKLRKQLQEAEDGKQAAVILGEAIKKSGGDLAHEAKQWLESEETQEKMSAWKEYAFDVWKKTKKQAKGEAKRTYRRVQKTLVK